MTHALKKESRNALPAKAGDMLKKFLDTFADSVPEEDRLLAHPQELADTAALHLKMTRERKPGQPAVHVHTPVTGADGGEAYTVIDIVNDDMPFIVASVAAEITHKYKLIRLLLHPMMHIERDGKGKVTGIAAKSGDHTFTQSHLHIQLQGTVVGPQAKQLEKDLKKVLVDVHYATGDWQKMRQKLLDCHQNLGSAPRSKYSEDQIKEYLEFLNYLYDNNFTLLGYREYEFSQKNGKIESRAVKNTSLGLLRSEIKHIYINEGQDSLPQNLQKLRLALPPVTIAKLSQRSTVHRPVPMDTVAVKKYDAKGKVVGESVFIGLFTSVTYSRSIQDIPLLRRKTENVLALSDFKPNSHDHKALRHVLEKYPRDELFQMDEHELLQTCVSIMNLQERQRISLYVRQDAFGRYVSCLVYVPRDRYDTRLRMTIQRILEEEFGGETGDFYTNLDDSPLARVMFVIYTRGNKPKSQPKDIEKRLRKAGRLWRERLADAMLKSFASEDEALRLTHRYAEAFPAGYQEEYLPKQAIFDIHKIEEALRTDTVALDLYKCKHCGDAQIRLKVYHLDTPMILSDVLPVLENMGLRVIAEMPYEVRIHEENRAVWIHDFMLQQNQTGAAQKIEDVKANFEEALEKVWYGDVENDGINELVLSAGMKWLQIRALRTYVRYMRQMGYQLGTRYIEQALTRNPAIARLIVELFETMFDPKHRKGADDKVEKIRDSIIKALENVKSLDEDRILRSLVNLMGATLRTNYFQVDENGLPRPCLAIKLDSSKIRDLPKPVPYREIFVFSPRVEGVHLRGDVIARGGIRWSDRHEDFRTEVLGLMKAQQVKNSVIVPMGAKGGFILKRPPTEGGRDAFMTEGIACYKLFINSLLDITDNRKGAKVIKPKDTVCRDGDDPYLVVAADKGTASFSDIANRISQDHGFWLDDAFASGGSAGYDHKKMGITAKGAWESVKRHFRELNHDIQKDAFNVIGVGDMGGDVFGNGMLLSKEIRLIGAFNHMHIFCDPSPDAAASFKERARLFKAVKGWGDYDEKLLSPGGRIFLRSDKSLALTPEIRKAFDIDAEKVTPAELIQAMLRARTDLLWFGGIGTYIKATHETNTDVGDRGNDALRINASELRANVIGEGANLAVTQAARIEAARKGIKLNADFIDNSGGVDSSDHEVNIKILMAEIMQAKGNSMTLPARDKLLGQMTDEIATLVLRNNYQQAQAISLMELNAAKTLAAHARFIRDLERKHGIDRKLEGLPDEEEIERRLQTGRGLSRPELAILQAYAKILFSKDIVKTDIPDLPVMQDYWLIDYFPVPLRKKYRDAILQHRLRREIVATTMSTSLVNRMGPVFVKEMMDKTGASCDDVARAYLVVRDAFDLRSFWDKVEALDNKVPAQVQLKAMHAMASLVERETFWFLTRMGRQPDLKKDTADFGKGVAALHESIDSILPHALSQNVRQRTDAGANDGLPRDLARQVALVPLMGAAFDIIRISLDRKMDLKHCARVYYELGEYFHIDWLRAQARYMTADDRWSGEALDSIVEELNTCQAGITGHIIAMMDKKVKNTKLTESIVDHWVDKHCPQARQLEPLFAELHRIGSIDLPMLVIATQRLRSLYGG